MTVKTLLVIVKTLLVHTFIMSNLKEFVVTFCGLETTNQISGCAGPNACPFTFCGLETTNQISGCACPNACPYTMQVMLTSQDELLSEHCTKAIHRTTLKKLPKLLKSQSKLPMVLCV